MYLIIFTGDDGLQGSSGMKGLKGEPGLTGRRGVDGDEGPAGIPGRSGRQGSNGLRGIEGDQGEFGPTGNDYDILLNDRLTAGNLCLLIKKTIFYNIKLKCSIYKITIITCRFFVTWLDAFH